MIRAPLRAAFGLAALGLAPLALDAGQGAPAAPGKARAEQHWQLEIRPLAERFERWSEVRLLLSVRNVGREPRAIALPWRAGARWPQWLRIRAGELELPRAEDQDFVAEPALLAPGEALSVLVPIASFLAPETLSSVGPGEFVVRWDGGTIGFATSASASFAVTGAPLPGPAAGSLESFLPVARPNEALGERLRAAWAGFLASPSDPRAIAFLGALPPEGLDPFSALQLLETTRDLGVRRALLALLARCGPDADAAERLLEFLQRHPDPSLLSLAPDALAALQGR